MPLGTEVGLGPGDIVLDGAQLPTKRGAADAPYLMWSNGWMDQDAIGTEVGLVPGHIVLDGDAALPLFGPCLLWALVKTCERIHRQTVLLTDKQTYTHADRNTSHAYRGQYKYRNLGICAWASQRGVCGIIYSPFWSSTKTDVRY